MPPLNAAIGPSIASASAIGIIPDRGRAEMIVKRMPAASTRSTAAIVPGVRRFCLSTSVPSTSETRRR